MGLLHRKLNGAPTGAHGAVEPRWRVAELLAELTQPAGAEIGVVLLVSELSQAGGGPAGGAASPQGAVVQRWPSLGASWLM